jgi:hypothetical protein
MSMSMTIEDRTVRATTPEGLAACMEVSLFFQRWLDHQASAEGLCLPAGYRGHFIDGNTMILVYEFSPAVHRIDWIRDDSPTSHGEGATYNKYALAFPFTILLAVFTLDRGKLTRAKHAEAYFRPATLKSFQDRLYYPPLLNISRFLDAVPPLRKLRRCLVPREALVETSGKHYAFVATEGVANYHPREIHLECPPLPGLEDLVELSGLPKDCRIGVPRPGFPLSWLCTQHTRGDYALQVDPEHRLGAALDALSETLFVSRFNRSSEAWSDRGHNHEARSWFTVSRQLNIDPRVSSPSAWAAATAHDPLFILDVPFLQPVGGLTVEQAARRSIRNHLVLTQYTPTARAEDVARLVFHYGNRE